MAGADQRTGLCALRRWVCLSSRGHAVSGPRCPQPRGRDVSETMSWYPLVTFWQVTIDMTNSQSVPDGHGHMYRSVLLRSWLALAAPPGWSDVDTQRAAGILGV